MLSIIQYGFKKNEYFTHKYILSIPTPHTWIWFSHTYPTYMNMFCSYPPHTHEYEWGPWCLMLLLQTGDCRRGDFPHFSVLSLLSLFTGTFLCSVDGRVSGWRSWELLPHVVRSEARDAERQPRFSEHPTSRVAHEWLSAVWGWDACLQSTVCSSIVGRRSPRLFSSKGFLHSAAFLGPPWFMRTVIIFTILLLECL